MAREMARTSPFRICCAQLSTGVGIAGELFLSEKLASDHQPLNFAGALANGAELNVPVEFFGRVILDESVSTENLHGFIGYANRNFARVEFGHAGFAREARIASVGKPRRAIGEQTGGINFGGHIGELKLN